MIDLQEELGDIDIYLLDQVMRGRLQSGMKILDAGCGSGRNLVYFLKNGYEVHGVDQSAGAVENTIYLKNRIDPNTPDINFSCSAIENAKLDSNFDAVICCAVLHFSKSEEQFHGIIDNLWNCLKSGGIFFARLSTSIGVESHIRRIEGYHYELPAGYTWFLPDEQMLLDKISDLGAKPLDPIKTVNVQNQRTMTTLCLRKG